MKQFKYTAVNINKKKFTGTFLADDEKDLATQLAKQNLFLVSCSEYTGKTPSAFFTTGTGKVNMTELTTFCRQLAIMLDSGITVLDSLESLKEQAYSTFFKSILQIIYDDVKSGVVFSAALDKHSKVFPEFFRSMVYVGEVSGKLNLVFKSLADYYEKDAAIKRKTKSAMSYPIMLLLMTVGIIILMLVFIVPTFRNSLSSLNATPSALTQTLYDMSDFMINYGAIVLLVLIVIALVIFGLLKSKSGKAFMDKVVINLPLVKKIQTDLIAARFTRGFGLMLASGMDIVEALDAIVVVIGNKDAEARFKLASAEVKHGTKLAVAFEKYKLFPSMLLQMIGVGERTGSLDEILNRSCGYFDEQVEISLNSVTSKIQPIMLMILGVIIALMFIAIYSPMISIMQSLI